MARNLSLDMGFDNATIGNPDNENRSPLTVGFVDLDDPNGCANSVLLSRSLVTGDTISLRIFDLSSVPVEVSKMSLRISFHADLESGQQTTPVLPSRYKQNDWLLTSYSNFRIAKSSTDLTSPLFQIPAPTWLPELDFKKPPFSVTQLESAPQASSTAVFEIKHPGMFCYTAILMVTFEDTFTMKDLVKVYRADPEMITSDGNWHRGQAVAGGAQSLK